VNAITPIVRVEKIGAATLYLGDSRNVMPLFLNVDAVVTDPPYGICAADWDKDVPLWALRQRTPSQDLWERRWPVACKVWQGKPKDRPHVRMGAYRS
jgi:DNA modification methylase